MTFIVQIIIGSFILSIIHASIPNHWLPLVTIGKAEKWSLKETLRVSAIVGSSHILSTIIVGILIGAVGYKLSSSYEMVTKVIAPTIIIILGIIYLIKGLIGFHKHNHEHFKINSKKSKTAIIVSLCIALFFSPCIEIEGYYFIAGTKGWLGIAIVSIIYFIVTLCGILIFVSIAYKGIEKIKWHFMEHHNTIITSITLIILGGASYFIS